MSEQTTTRPEHARAHAQEGADVAQKDYWCPAWCDGTYCSDVDQETRYHHAALGWTEYAGYGNGATAYEVELMWAQRCDVDPDMANAMINITEMDRQGRDHAGPSEMSPLVAQQLALALQKGGQMLMPLDGNDAPALQAELGVFIPPERLVPSPTGTWRWLSPGAGGLIHFVDGDTRWGFDFDTPIPFYLETRVNDFSALGIPAEQARLNLPGSSAARRRTRRSQLARRRRQAARSH